MKKLSGILFLISTLFGIVFISLTKSDTEQNEREAYETFLLSQAENFKLDKNISDLPDNPDAAALQNYFMTIDPVERRVPSERLNEAYKATKQLKQKALQKSSKVVDWTETGSNMGGRTRAIMWDPNDPDGNKVWAGGVTGGLWTTEDIYSSSTSWLPIDDFWPSLSISCIVFDPNDSQTFYIGTGEYQTARHIYRESSGVGIGIWKSNDGGSTWALIPSTADFKYISDIKVRNEDGISVVYAGVVSGFYHGVNHQSAPNDGLYRSADGGETWEQVLPDIAGEDVPYAPAHLDISAADRIFVGTMKNLDGKGGASILYSDNGLSGSWTVYDDYEAIIQNDPSYPVPGRVIMACAPSNADIVYALVGAGWFDSMGGNRAEGKYILKSTDGGASWSETNIPGNDPGWASLSWHAFAAVANPTNPNDLHVGGLDVWKTLNGGSSWNHLSDWALMYNGGGDEYVHADQHIQVYKPGSSNEMLLGSDGGVFYTDNASGSYPDYQEKNKNYSTLQFYSCDIYPVSGQSVFIGGLQDNGSLLYQGQPLDINDMVSGGDGAYCFFDEDEPEVMITSTYYNRYYLFLNFSYIGWTGDYGTGVFVNPADYDSENNILFCNGVTFTGDYSNSLLRITGIPNNSNDQMISLGTGVSTYFSHIKVSPFATPGSSSLFVGTQNGRLFKVTNAESTPNAIEIGDENWPTAYLSSTDIGGSEDTLLVTFSNYGVPSVWQTYDGGLNWVDISGNLPDMPIRWCLYHPENSKQIMLATEIGIWTTLAAHVDEVNWAPDPGMANVRIDMLQMRDADNTVLAATHGRGLQYLQWETAHFNYDLWSQQAGSSGSNLEADYNNDNQVDNQDKNMWY